MNTKLAPSLILVCPTCGASNRAPKGRALSEGKCGKCGGALATPEPVDIDEVQLNRLRAKDTGAFIVDVWAPWCGPCRMMAPAYAAAARELVDQVRLFKLNYDQNQSAASALGIRGVPTLFAYRGGQQVAQQSGAPTGPALQSWIKTSLGLAGRP